MGPLDGNREEVRRSTIRVLQTDHGEASAVDRRWDGGYTRGGSSAGSGGNSVGNDIYRDMVGNCGTVGGVTTNIKIVSRG